MFKKLFKILLTKKQLKLIKVDPSDEFMNISFGQEAEDLLLKRWFRNKTDGFYIDVGAHHPFRFSNTYIFYKGGWKGINIDATPGSMEPFKKHRPNDTNIEAAISDKKRILKFYIFKEKAFNTFEEETANLRLENKLSVLEEIKELTTFTLEEILDKHLSKKQKIDFLTIDVEGHDLSILKSNNWQKYRPSVVLLEDLGGTIENVLETEAYQFLKKRDYSFKSRMDNTIFFMDNLFKPV